MQTLFSSALHSHTHPSCRYASTAHIGTYIGFPITRANTNSDTHVPPHCVKDKRLRSPKQTRIDDSQHRNTTYSTELQRKLGRYHQNICMSGLLLLLLLLLHTTYVRQISRQPDAIAEARKKEPSPDGTIICPHNMAHTHATPRYYVLRRRFAVRGQNITLT